VYCVAAAPALYLALRLGALGRPWGARARVFVLACAACVAAALHLQAWRLERRARGCTPLVLACLAAMAALLALWLWALGSPLAPDEEDTAAEDHHCHCFGGDDVLALQQPACEKEGGGGACARWRRRSRRALPRGMAYTLCAAAAALILAAYGASRVARSFRTFRCLLMRARARAAAALADPPPPRRRAGARQLDVAWAVACAPRSALQLHAVWHVLAAAALWTFWLFLRSEQAPP
jgi:hypothetical protein